MTDESITELYIPGRGFLNPYNETPGFAGKDIFPRSGCVLNIKFIVYLFNPPLQHTIGLTAVAFLASPFLLSTPPPRMSHELFDSEHFETKPKDTETGLNASRRQSQMR